MPIRKSPLVRVVGKRKIVREREITADDDLLEDHDFGTGADGRLVIREEVEVSDDEYHAFREKQKRLDRAAVSKLVQDLKPSGYAIYLAVVDAIGRVWGDVAPRLEAGKNLFVIVRAPHSSWQSACDIGTAAALAELSLRVDAAQIDSARILPTSDRRMAIPVAEVIGKLEAQHVVLVLRRDDQTEPQLGPIVDAFVDLTEMPSAFLDAAAARQLGNGEKVSLRLRAGELPVGAFDAAASRATTAKEVTALAIRLIAAQLEAEHLLEAAQRPAAADAEEKRKAAEQAAIQQIGRAGPPPTDTLRVIAKLDDPQGNSDRKSFLKMFQALAEKPTPLTEAIAVAERMADVAARWPHARDLVLQLLRDLREGEPFRLRPTLLVGPPGTGKTRLLTAVAQAFDIASIVYPCASVADSSFGGTPAQWSTRRASTPLELIRTAGIANPVVVLDEIEKTGRSDSNGSLVHALLPLLELHTSRTYYETALETNVDLSGVSFLATANSLDGVPAPLRDRFRILRMPDPAPEHLPVLAPAIVEEIGRERDLPRGFLEPLAPDELDVVARVWGGGSLRKLRTAIEAAVDFRDARRTMQ